MSDQTLSGGPDSTVSEHDDWPFQLTVRNDESGRSLDAAIVYPRYVDAPIRLPETIPDERKQIAALCKQLLTNAKTHSRILRSKNKALHDEQEGNREYLEEYREHAPGGGDWMEWLFENVRTITLYLETLSTHLDERMRTAERGMEVALVARDTCRDFARVLGGALASFAPERREDDDATERLRRRMERCKLVMEMIAQRYCSLHQQYLLLLESEREIYNLHYPEKKSGNDEQHE